MADRRVILYELNEVPWVVVDQFVRRHPRSHLARRLGSALTRTTVDDDPVKLQPWRTWPTFHTSRYADEHHSMALGQDPATFEGATIWDVVADAGRPIGLFGPMQSWPPRSLPGGGFHVPDTFATTAATVPPELERFQALNLRMTTENTFASNAPLEVRTLLGAALDLVVRGLRPASAWQLARHLIDERRDARYTARRAAMQVLPGFDVFHRLDRRHRPHLSIFFTNHVAAMQHRYWGDGMDGYADAFQYEPDPVFAGFVMQAMAMFDAQLGRLLASADDDTIVLVASSMGQAPTAKEVMDDCYVLRHPDQLVATLGLQAEVVTAMYPNHTFTFADDAAAEAGAQVLASVRFDGRRRIRTIDRIGPSVSIALARFPSDAADTSAATWVDGGGAERRAPVSDLGVVVEHRLGGGDSGGHCPEGVLFGWGPGMTPDASRRAVSILDVAPSILELLDLEAPPSMRGRTGVFAAAGRPLED